MRIVERKVELAKGRVEKRGGKTSTPTSPLPSFSPSSSAVKERQIDFLALKVKNIVFVL